MNGVSESYRFGRLPLTFSTIWECSEGRMLILVRLFASCKALTCGEILVKSVIYFVPIHRQVFQTMTNSWHSLEKGMKVFELGYGCGYSAAITYHLIRPSGHLVAAEIIDELAELGRNNLETHLGKVGVKSKGWKLFDMMGQLLSREEKVKLISGNGLEVLEKEAPFDRIYLTAGVDLESFDPSKLATHLNPKGGILLFPEERGDLIKQLYKGGNLIDTKRYGDGRILFVPLTGINS